MIPAEQAVLGAIMQRPKLAADVFGVVNPEDFHEPRHADLALLLLEMTATGAVIDAQTVLADVRRRGWLPRLPGPYLLELIERAFVPDNALAYAAEVRRESVRRQLVAALETTKQRLASAEGDETQLATELLGTLDRLRMSSDSEPLAMTVEDLLAGSDDYDWLVPGLLERGERVMFTANEGAGKSMLLRQVAVTLAAGLHPFSFIAVPACRVLIVDCENSERQTRRKIRPMVAAAASLGHQVRADRLRVDFRTRGLDLTKHADAGWLLRRVVSHRPHVLCIGPLYKLHNSSPSDEEAARKVADALDAVRQRVGCALILETHAPHRESARDKRGLRPIGSSLWMRWPEFGYGLNAVEDEKLTRITYDLEPWRGARDERAWPERIQHGVSGFPWEEAPPAVNWNAGESA